MQAPDTQSTPGLRKAPAAELFQLDSQAAAASPRGELAARSPGEPPSEPAPAPESRSATAFPLVALCFFLSGIAALVYQTAWMRQFSVVFGTSEPAVATVLAAYMSGLALGAWVAGKLLVRVRRPVATYALLELGVALGALFVPIGLKLARVLQASLLGGAVEPPDAGAWNHVAFYLVTAFVLVLVPTSCMGATLPLLVRHAVRKNEEIARRSGALYSINTAGAVLGALGGAFYLLPRLGLMGTIWAGVGINALVFLLATRMRESGEAPSEEPAPRPVLDRRGRAMLVLIALSGAVSFGYEVLWTRMLGHVLGGSLFAFAIMLASFLVGIALGSALASGKGKTRDAAAAGFARAQVGTAIGAVLAWFALGALPSLAAGLGIGEDAGLFSNASAALCLMLPATLFIGATFPFAIRVVALNANAAGDASARVLTWNTAGATIGALLAGFWLVPALEFEGATKFAVLANLTLAVLGACLVSAPGARKGLAFACLAALLVCAAAFRPQRPDAILLASSMQELQAPSPILFADVGPSATVLVTTFDSVYQVRVNGLPQAAITKKGGLEFTGRQQRWLAALPLVARPDTRSMLMIGLGGGVAAEGLPASVEQIDIMELAPEVTEANRFLSDLRDTDPLADPRVRLIENDARSALALSTKRWDAIVSQPSHPWTAGASHLFTTEFAELAKSRLNKGGVFLQWMSTRSFDDELLATYAATLVAVFPHVRGFQTSPNTLLFLGSQAPLDFEAALAEGHAYAHLKTYFASLGVHEPEDVIALVRLDRVGLRELARGATPSTDDQNRLAMRGAHFARVEAASDMSARIAKRSVLSTADAPQWTQYGFDPTRVALRATTLGMLEQADAIASTIQDPLERALAGAQLARCTGRMDVFRRMLEEACAIDPTDERAAYLKLESQLGQAPAAAESADARWALTRLGPAPRAVIEAWPAFVAGDFAALASFEGDLAQSHPGAPWDRLAQQLRVTWRLFSAAHEGRRDRAEEALALLDRVLGDGPNLSLLALRCEAASLCDRPQVLLASADYASLAIAERGVDASAAHWSPRLVAALDALLDGDVIDPRVDEALFREVYAHLQGAAEMQSPGS